MSLKKLMTSYASYNLSADQQLVNWLQDQFITIAHQLDFTEMPSTDFLFFSLNSSNH